MTPTERLVAEAWRSALDSAGAAACDLRGVYPSHTGALGVHVDVALGEALRALEKAWHALNGVAAQVVGDEYASAVLDESALLVTGAVA